MNKLEFNEYCAKVVCLEDDGVIPPIYLFNPYDNLNDMAKIIDKLTEDMEQLAFADFIDLIVRSKTIKQAFRDFIESTAKDS